MQRNNEIFSYINPCIGIRKKFKVNVQNADQMKRCTINISKLMTEVSSERFMAQFLSASRTVLATKPFSLSPQAILIPMLSRTMLIFFDFLWKFDKPFSFYMSVLLLFTGNLEIYMSLLDSDVFDISFFFDLSAIAFEVRFCA